jgi:HSP20 family protein
MFDIIRAPRKNVDRFWMSDLFADFFAPDRAWPVSSRPLVAPVDVRETDAEYRLSMELPGLAADAIDVTVEGRTLTMSGEKKEEVDRDDDGTRRSERRYGRFSRSFSLPAHVDPAKIAASYKDGVLVVTVPKGPESRAQRIAVASV